MPEPSAKLISKANAAAIRFLITELETGLSFCRMASRVRSRKKARSGDADKVKRYLDYARLAYDTASSHLGTANGTAEELLEINEKVAKLQKMLEKS